jgi:hypothetical protein
MKYLLLLTFIILFSCSNNKKSTVQPIGKLPEKDISIWSNIPGQPHGVLFIDHKLVHKKTNILIIEKLNKYLSLKFNEGISFSKLVFYSKKSFIEKLFIISGKNNHNWGKKSYRNFKTGNHKKYFLASNGEKTFLGRNFLIKSAIDLDVGVESIDYIASDFLNVVPLLHSFGKPPGILGLFIINSKLKSWFSKYLTNLPNRFGFQFRFTKTWVVFKMVLVFQDTITAEKFIMELKNFLIKSKSCPFLNLKKYSLLKTLSVHPEGQNVYIQWNGNSKTGFSFINEILKTNLSDYL